MASLGQKEKKRQSRLVKDRRTPCQRTRCEVLLPVQLAVHLQLPRVFMPYLWKCEIVFFCQEKTLTVASARREYLEHGCARRWLGLEFCGQTACHSGVNLGSAALQGEVPRQNAGERSGLLTPEAAAKGPVAGGRSHVLSEAKTIQKICSRFGREMVLFSPQFQNSEFFMWPDETVSRRQQHSN